MFYCDLLPKSSNSAPLRHRPVEIESDHNDYAIDFISDARVDNWPNRRDLYLQFLTQKERKKEITYKRACGGYWVHSGYTVL